MPKVWSSLFGGGKPNEERFTLDDLSAQIAQYNSLGYPVGGGFGLGGTERLENDFSSYVNQIYKGDGIVFACLVARMRVFSQIRFAYQKLRNGKPGDLFSTRELAILEKPDLSMGTSKLLSKAIQHADLAGNHYACNESDRIKVLRPDWVDIVLTAPPDEAYDSDIAGWVYKPGGTNDRSLWRFFVAGDDQFAHWAPTPDPEAQYRGMSPLTSVIEEIVGDKATTKHKGKFFTNGATPSFAVSFKESVTVDQFRDFKAAMRETHQGADNAYKPLFLGGGADVKPLMYDLRQLDFKATQGAGETRIAAALRIHPVIVGLSEGMQGSSLNAGNFKAAKDGWVDGELRPLWESLCQAYSGLIRVPSDARLFYDDDISFLREDIEQKAKVKALEADIIQGLIMQGFTAESAVKALMEDDWDLLTHSGLYSVQLQPPLPDGPQTLDQSGNPVKKPTAPAAATGTPKPKPATGPAAAGRPAAGQPRPGAKPPPPAKA